MTTPGLDGPFGDELRVAFELVREAGAEVYAIQRGEFAVEMKPGDEPVTVADRRGSEIILAGLARAFPNDPVISEEAPPPEGAQASQRLWLVDPIDGTKDFIRREDGYSVMLGLLVDGKPVLGGIPASARHLAFQAEQVPAGSRWKVIGISREQWPLARAALSLGGDVRVGLEDNFYLPNGEMAKSNGELVASAAELVKLSGRSVASVDDAKRLLWPNGNHN